MAPTICTEKKRQARSSLKDLRRQPGVVSTSTAATPNSGVGAVGVRGGNTGSNVPSSIINYVSKGALAKTLRPHVNRAENFSMSNADNVVRKRRLHSQQQQISDNAVSSSTHSDSDMQLQRRQSARCALGYNQRRLLLMDQDDEDTRALGELDEADCEVHSINSGCPVMIASSSCSNSCSNSSSDSSDYNSHTSGGFATLLRNAALQAVFSAPPLSDKQPLLSNPSVLLAKTNKLQNDKNNSSKVSTTSSETYTNMCELKNTEGLLAIALKTIKLVKRNQLLQHRLAQLQVETSEFIQSVLANPENQRFRHKMQTSGASLGSPVKTNETKSPTPSENSTSDKVECE